MNFKNRKYQSIVLLIVINIFVGILVRTQLCTKKDNFYSHNTKVNTNLEKISENNNIFYRNEILKYIKNNGIAANHNFFSNKMFKMLFHFDLNRTPFNNKSLKSAKEINFNLLEDSLTFIENQENKYIAISNLYNDGYKLFMRHLEQKAKSGNFDTCFIDLSELKEGDLSEAIKIANQCVSESDLTLLQIRYFNGTENTIKSKGKIFFPFKYYDIKMNNNTGELGFLLAGMIKLGSKAGIKGEIQFPQFLLESLVPLSFNHWTNFFVGYYILSSETNKNVRTYDELKVLNEAIFK